LLGVLLLGERRDDYGLSDREQEALHLLGFQITLAASYLLSQQQEIEGREEERLTMARELHDGPLQELLALFMGLEKKSARALKSDLEKSMAHLRQICSQLRPPILIDEGLSQAIRFHAQKRIEERAHLTLHLDLAEECQPLRKAVATALFRIYQQALENIIRHSGATEAWVSLTISPSETHLAIQDNGTGFALPPNWRQHFTRLQHFGVAGMVERACAVGGQMEIESGLGQGTRICVVVPHTR
jgi:signal transduction histidine kinase